MNYIYKLEIIELKLDKLSFFQKIELYLLPIILCFLIFILIPKKEHMQISLINENIQKLQNKTLSKTYLEFTKEYTKYIKKNNITLENINVEENKIKLNIKSSLYKLLKFIFYIENSNAFSSISSFKFNQSNNTFKLHLYVNYEKFYIRNKKINIEEKLSFLNKKSLVIDAYIDNFILVKNKWLRIGQEIDGMKLINIDADYAFFKTEDKKIIKVLKYERTR